MSDIENASPVTYDPPHEYKGPKIMCESCGKPLPFPDRQPYNAQICDYCDWVWRRPGGRPGDNVPVWGNHAIFVDAKTTIRVVADYRGRKIGKVTENGIVDFDV